MPVALNFVAFQFVWFLSLQGAGSGRHWQGTLAFVAFIGLHLAMSRTRTTDARLVLAAAACGLVLDTVYAQARLLDYAAPLPVRGLAPYWIVVMWANFGLTLNSCLRWLQGRWFIAAVGGAIGGPLAYLAGIRLGAAEIAAEPALVYGVLAITWAAAVPLLLAVAQRLRQAASDQVPG